MKTWQRKETKDSKDFGGRKKPRSGGLWFAPGDVSIDQFLLDDKTTVRKSFSITLNMWKKIYEEALKSQKMPCLSVRLGDGTEVVVLSKDDFLTFFKEKK